MCNRDEIVKVSRRQLGWIIAALAFTLAAILWHSMLWQPTSSPVGVKLSTVERAADPVGVVSCSFTVTNLIDRRVVFQAWLERLIGGEWRIIPCSQPGPMYVSALWGLDVGETKSLILPMPLDDQGDVTYRIGVDYWLRESRVRVWKEKLRNVGFALLRREPPNSGLAVIRGRAGTLIDWAARLRVNTEAWNSVQQHGPANGSQPTRSKTNQTSSAAGFRR
jgi:hypothetical protein